MMSLNPIPLAKALCHIQGHSRRFGRLGREHFREDYSADHTVQTSTSLKEFQAEGPRCGEETPSWGHTETPRSLAPSPAPRLGGCEPGNRGFCCPSPSVFASVGPRHLWPWSRMESAPEHSLPRAGRPTGRQSARAAYTLASRIPFRPAAASLSTRALSSREGSRSC